MALTRSGKGVFWVGALAILIYCLSIRPPQSPIGYVEDQCIPDLARQALAENFSRGHGLSFRSDGFFAPFGASIPYFSWAVERDGLGAVAWSFLGPEFPWLWSYFGLSLGFTFLLAGFVFGRMGMGPRARWGWALACVLLHVPRHFKVWHHFEHLPLHWVYASILIEAWIWKRAVRDGRWSLGLEGWRLLALQGVFLTSGYFWGPMLLLWLLGRASLAALAFSRWRRGWSLQASFDGWRAPLVCGLLLLAVQIPWFWALFQEVKIGGKVGQANGWFAFGPLFFYPAFFEPLVAPLRGLAPWVGRVFRAIDEPETVVTVGWTFILPFFVSLWALRKRRGGYGWVAVAPLLAYFLFSWAWAVWAIPEPALKVIQGAIPFLEFNRVASRWALFWPPLLTALIALSWPEVSALWDRLRARRCGVVLAFLGGVIVAGEAAMLAWPVNQSPPVSPQLARFLEGVRQAPGETVLDFPMCVAGGNGYCTADECPQYPGSTVAQCLRAWHGKATHSIYQSRNLGGHCWIYRRRPFMDWAAAFRERRCLTDPEFDDLCGYLERGSGYWDADSPSGLDLGPGLGEGELRRLDLGRPDGNVGALVGGPGRAGWPAVGAAEPPRRVAALLVHPQLWGGEAESQECFAKFVRRLGPPVDAVRAPLSASRRGEHGPPLTIVRFAPRCVRQP